MLIQILSVGFAIYMNFSLSSNLVLAYIFCFMQDSCLRMQYPNSLIFEKKKDTDPGFIFFTLLAGLKVIPFLVLGYLCLLLQICAIGYLKSWAYVLYAHLNGLNIIEAYPNIPYYFIFFICLFIIFIYVSYKVYIGWDNLVAYVANYSEIYLKSNKALINALLFLKKFKSLPFYVYALIILGCVLKTQACVVGLLVLFAFYTQGFGFLVLILVSGCVHIVLCIPTVHSHFIKNYGSDAYYLLGWNMFTQSARNIGRAAGAFILFDTGRTGTEQIANTINNTTNFYADSAVNKLVTAQREKLAQSLVSSHGLSLEQARKTAANRLSFQHTPPSNARFLRLPKFSWPWSKDKDKGNDGCD